jgi:hypothetical protein
MNAADHFLPVKGVMRSFLAFRVKAAAAVEKETQGEVSTRARKGEERVSGRMGTVVEGWGWRMWERRARARFAPAESPVRIMLPGAMCRVWRTW